MPNEVLIYLYLCGCFTVLFWIIDYVLSDEYTLGDVFIDIVAGFCWPIVMIIVLGALLHASPKIVLKKKKKDKV
jgi:hypothetical protein